MVDLDTFYHLPYDGVIIDIFILSPLVDDVLDFLEPCLKIAILTLALTDCCDAFGYSPFKACAFSVRNRSVFLLSVSD